MYIFTYSLGVNYFKRICGEFINFNYTKCPSLAAFSRINVRLAYLLHFSQAREL